jgi:hypothetical protein
MKFDGSKTHMRAFHILVAVVLLAVAALAADDKPAKPPKPPPPPKAHPNAAAARGPEAPPRPIDQQIERLAKMSPEQREKVLSNLTPERRARIEAGIVKWNKSSAQLKALADKFQSLPPDTQKRIRQLSQRLKSLPPNRKMAVAQELDRLRAMPEAQRERRLNNPNFQKNFTIDEQEILREIPAVLPPNTPNFF